MCPCRAPSQCGLPPSHSVLQGWPVLQVASVPIPPRASPSPTGLGPLLAPQGLLPCPPLAGLTRGTWAVVLRGSPGRHLLGFRVGPEAPVPFRDCKASHTHATSDTPQHSRCLPLAQQQKGGPSIHLTAGLTFRSADQQAARGRSGYHRVLCKQSPGGAWAESQARIPELVRATVGWLCFGPCGAHWRFPPQSS